MSPSERTESVLVVDDDQHTRNLMAGVLRGEGYETREAGDADTALVQVSGEASFGPVDLVVLDLILPGRNGIEVCADIKRMYPDVPVLFVSALADASYQRAALDAGADDFLTKPVHRGELLLRVRSLLVLRRMQRELSRQNQVLTQQRDALVSMTRQKQELSEILVHDLKNPLAAIASNASFLVSAKVMTDDVRECAAAIGRAADNMLRMVHNLLDVSRAEEVGLTPHFEIVELGSLVERATSLLARRAEERGIRLDARVYERLRLRADADYVRRLLENLLDNALRYTPAGGSVEVALRSVDGEVELQVSDEGPGVPQEQRERIFDKYAQLDRSVDRAQHRYGRGLGLMFCRLVAEAHGGRIWVEDNAPSGARFRVRLAFAPT